MGQSITLHEQQAPTGKDVDQDIDWLCESLGLVAGRDTARVSPRIVKILLHGDEMMTSESIAQALELETQRVLYHLRSLIGAGLLVRQSRQIALRHGSMTGAVGEIRRDAERIFDRLLAVARDVDQDLGLEHR